MSNSICIGDVHELTAELGDCAAINLKQVKVYCVADIPGEDHILISDRENKSILDLLFSKSRKFVFTWYYLLPSVKTNLLAELQQTVLNAGYDFVVKYPNIPIHKSGWPSIIRHGHKEAGTGYVAPLNAAIQKALSGQYLSKDALTYRNYNWREVPNAFSLIRCKAIEMAHVRLGERHQDKSDNIRGYCLYAGCAYSYLYPELGFGMRDIDVQVFFSPDWFTNTRAAFTRHCGIEQFGAPAYFDNKTRWLDLMWNSFHVEHGDFGEDVRYYISEMRHRSDRWATISQRPMIDLKTGKTLYIPNWIKNFKSHQAHAFQLKMNGVKSGAK